MSTSAIKRLLTIFAGPEDDADEAAAPDVVVEEDDDLAGAIESWFEKGEEFDRRYGEVEHHAG